MGTRDAAPNTRGVGIAWIAFFAGVLALAALLALWLASRSPPAPMAPRWLVLPQDNWDVGAPQARQLFHWAETMPDAQGVPRGGYAGSLQSTCGGPDQPEEHYVALIDTVGQRVPWKLYRLDFVPRPHETVDVTVVELARAEHPATPRVQHLSMARAGLAQIQHTGRAKPSGASSRVRWHARTPARRISKPAWMAASMSARASAAVKPGRPC